MRCSSSRSLRSGTAVSNRSATARGGRLSMLSYHTSSLQGAARAVENPDIVASIMAKPRRGYVLDLTIDDLAFGGEGVGRVQGYVLFMRGAVPGPYGYRNKMEFTIMHGADAPEIGLHQADRYDVVLDIERCHLHSDTMNTLLGELRAQARARRLSVYDQDSGTGLLRFATVREGRRTGEAMVNIVAAAPDVETLAPVAADLRARVPALASVVLNVNAKKASVAVGTEEHLLLGRDHIRESLGGLTFQVSASSFFQTNTVQAERLFAVVEAACELGGTETVMDLY